MHEYLIVHRGDEIHRLRFKQEEDDLYFLETNVGIFCPVYGWEASKVIQWLEERGFEYYWEKDND